MTDQATMNGHAAEAPPQPEPTYELLTPAKARERRQREERGYLFQLKATGGYAHVRLPNLADKATIKALPQQMQATVREFMFDVQDRDIKTIDLADLLGGTTELANTYCLVGFINPPLVLTEADVTDPERQVVITDINVMDRMAFSTICEGGDRAETTRLIPFPAQPAGGVSAVQPVPHVPDDAIGADAVVSAGV